MNSLTRGDVFGFVAWAALGVGMLSGCAEKANPDLATPAATVQKYLAIADQLAAAREINIGGVREGLQCFSKADRDWFNKNFKDFPLDEITGNAAMAISEPAIRGSFVFMYGVVPRGPKGAGKPLEVTAESAADATVKVDNYFTIPLVKEGPNWRIKGIFGKDAN